MYLVVNRDKPEILHGFATIGGVNNWLVANGSNSTVTHESITEGFFPHDHVSTLRNYKRTYWHIHYVRAGDAVNWDDTYAPDEWKAFANEPT